MTKRRGNGEGGIDERGDGTYRLRYRVNGKRFTKTMKGTLAEARKELRGLLGKADSGTHVDPSKLTVGQWIDEWIGLGAPGRRKKKVGERTLERYEELLRVHVKPTLASRPVQQLKASEIDKLYQDLEEDMAPRTLHHVHTVFGACLAAAERTGKIMVSPMARLTRVPSPGESDHGVALDEAELAKLVAGFRPSSLYPMVALTAATGVRRNELLALRWSDLDGAKKTLRIERALEVTKKHGTRIKPPKTKRGLRTISLDDATIAMLLKVREKHQRVQAGVPDGADVDLSLVKLPDNALMFPAAATVEQPFSFTAPRVPRNFSKEFARRADLLDMGDCRFHDLRGTHATLLLDRNVPVHTVAERVGDDPAVLLRNYAKRKRNNSQTDQVAAAITGLAAGFLQG